MTYKQLNFEQRYSIEAMLKLKTAKRLIWQSMNISESTFYRELPKKILPMSILFKGKSIIYQ